MSKGRKKHCSRCGNCIKYTKMIACGRGKSHGFCEIKKMEVHPMTNYCEHWEVIHPPRHEDPALQGGDERRDEIT